MITAEALQLKSALTPTPPLMEGLGDGEAGWHRVKFLLSVPAQ